MLGLENQRPAGGIKAAGWRSPGPFRGNKSVRLWKAKSLEQSCKTRDVLKALTKFHGGARGGDHQHAVVGAENFVVDVNSNDGVGFHQFGALSQLAHRV